MTADSPAHELTRNPVDGTWGFVCREHGVLRSGLAERHALNVEAKHLREDHAEMEELALDLKAMAQVVWQHGYHQPYLWKAWQALTGLDETESHALAQIIVESDRAVRVAVVPF